MPSSSSVSPPDGGRRGAAEEGGGGGRLEEVVMALGLSWALEPPAGAASDTKTRRKNISKTMGAIFNISIYGMMMLGGGSRRATYWLSI